MAGIAIVVFSDLVDSTALLRGSGTTGWTRFAEPM